MSYKLKFPKSMTLYSVIEEATAVGKLLDKNCVYQYRGVSVLCWRNASVEANRRVWQADKDWQGHDND